MDLIGPSHIIKSIDRNYRSVTANISFIGNIVNKDKLSCEERY